MERCAKDQYRGAAFKMTGKLFLRCEIGGRTGTDLWQLAVMPCGWKRSRG